MQPSDEDRLRRLEESRYKIVGQLNAHRALLITAVATILQRSTSPSADVLAQIRQVLLPEHPKPAKIFPGIDAAELGALQQEYEASISQLLAEVAQALGHTK